MSKIIILAIIIKNLRNIATKKWHLIIKFKNNRNWKKILRFLNLNININIKLKKFKRYYKWIKKWTEIRDYKWFEIELLEALRLNTWESK